ncbi:MAG: nucleotidyltransferase domain-containing protein [Bacillota bacterium]
MIPAPLLDELGFAAEISSILGRDDVDVVNLNTAPVYIQHQVIYTGTKIYEKEA